MKYKYLFLGACKFLKRDFGRYSRESIISIVLFFILNFLYYMVNLFTFAELRMTSNSPFSLGDPAFFIGGIRISLELLFTSLSIYLFFYYKNYVVREVLLASQNIKARIKIIEKIDYVLQEFFITRLFYIYFFQVIIFFVSWIVVRIILSPLKSIYLFKGFTIELKMNFLLSQVFVSLFMGILFYFYQKHRLKRTLYRR
ncbi:MAG: hypothetical protein LBI13_01960 [Streptococcaceae bacterium]|jgi:hypothetical protein|nr:hypothetical protein [Streptococcaceae bacterium]